MKKSDAIREYRRLIRREGAALSLKEVHAVVAAVGLTMEQVIEDINAASVHAEATARAERITTARDEATMAESLYLVLDAQLAARQLKHHMSGLRELSRSDMDFKSQTMEAGRSLSALRKKLSRAQEAEKEVADIESSASRLFDPREEAKGGVDR